MIDITHKKETNRIARAQAVVKLNKEIIKKIKQNTIPKGNVLEAAKIAGLLAAKNTPGTIPLCHNIEIEYAGLDFTLKEDKVIVQSLIRATAKTGVEMEAMVACYAASLTIYDMCKMFTKSIEIQDVYLLEKRGGKSGVYRRR